MTKIRYQERIFRMISWLSKNRYNLLCGMIFFSVAIHASNGGWYGDFWEHSAVISELIYHPFSPGHPQLNLNLPHAFYSPYAIFWAIIARITHLDAISVLTIAGLLNFILLALAINLFAKTISEYKTHISAFYALLFVLFMWGRDPWQFSGFLHFWVIGDVLPYPSTFAIAISLIAISINTEKFIQVRWQRNALIYTIALLVLLTHPLTYIFLSIGLLTQSAINSKEFSYKTTLASLFKVISGLVLIFGLAELWPYYSISDLLLREGNVYHLANEGIYSHILQRIWPVLLLIPLTGWAMYQRNSQTILIVILMLFIIYILGYITQKYSFGRVIGMMALLIQILAAEGMARLEMRLYRVQPNLEVIAPILIMIVLMMLSLSWFIPAVQRSMTIANSILHGRNVSNQLAYKNLTFLTQTVNRSDLIISDIKTSWLIPTFGGRVIAAEHPLAFVSDQLERRENIERFFKDNQDNKIRLNILKKYKPKYLLLNKQSQNKWLEIEEFVMDNELGRIVYENEQYRLILLNQYL